MRVVARDDPGVLQPTTDVFATRRRTSDVVPGGGTLHYNDVARGSKSGKWRTQVHKRGTRVDEIAPIPSTPPSTVPVEPEGMSHHEGVRKSRVSKPFRTSCRRKPELKFEDSRVAAHRSAERDTQRLIQRDRFAAIEPSESVLNLQFSDYRRPCLHFGDGVRELGVHATSPSAARSVAGRQIVSAADLGRASTATSRGRCRAKANRPCSGR